MTHEIEEGRIAGELVGKIAEIVGVPPVFASDLLSQEVLLSAVKKLASQPAPSGWQQRIAAMDPWTPRQWCFFCSARRPEHRPDCLWQNAVDALSPASEADAIASAVRAELQPLEDALIDVGHKLAQQPSPDTCDDLCMLPAPEGESTARYLPSWTHACSSCGGFGGHEANCPGCFCKSCLSGAPQ